METLFGQLIGLTGLHIFKVDEKHDSYFLHCETYSKSCKCLKCGHVNTKVKQTYVRTVRDLPISGKRVYLKFNDYRDTHLIIPNIRYASD